MKIPVHHNPGSSPESPAADLQADQRIASNQNDDLAGLPAPNPGYEWVKVEILHSDQVLPGDIVRHHMMAWSLPLSAEPRSIFNRWQGYASCRGWVARQVPTPEPEGPEVIWETTKPAHWSYRVLANGTVQKKSNTDSTSVYDDICGGETVKNGMGQEIARLYAKDKANTALLDSFKEKLEEIRKAGPDSIGPDDLRADGMPYTAIIVELALDLAKAYKEAKGDAKQDV